MSVRIAISIGDYNGIGPEVVLKALLGTGNGRVTPLILASEEVLSFYRDRLDTGLSWHTASGPGGIVPGRINLLECFGMGDQEVQPGVLSSHAGACAMKAVDRGIALCLNGEADALVTAPISKEAVNRAGYAIPGHTEYLAAQTGGAEVIMMLVTDSLRVGLLTGHLPLKEVPAQVTQEGILRALTLMHRSLRDDFGIPSPRIAVLGLNPHAGDGGIMGREELEQIAPAVALAGEEGLCVSGPHPADGFFGNRGHEETDAVLAIYHDQGLIPFKALSFGKGVNVTAGLPIIRTSPDHGTAFDIAGRNRASPGSFMEAFRLAQQLAFNRTESMHEDE